MKVMNKIPKVKECELISFLMVELIKTAKKNFEI